MLMRQEGMVVAEPHGRFTYYRLVPDALDALDATDATAHALAELAQRARATATARREC